MLRLKGLQNTGFVQTEGGLTRQTQTYAHGCAVADSIANGGHKRVETLAYLIPALPCMDIRAVGQMRLGDEPFQLHGIRCAVSAKR